MIFTARQLSKVISGPVSAFYWPNKGVSYREALWTILLKLGCLERGEGRVLVETEVK